MRQRACISRCQGSTADGTDAEGYADAYLFTPDDVRWAAFKSDLKYVKAPDESD